MKIHPASQILTWCLLVATLQAMTFGALLLAAGMILLCAFALSRHKFIQLVRRTRWIMLSLLVIYAYSTPGQPLSEALGMFSPSTAGLSDGVLQLTRLLAALAGLAILLDRLHRQQLIAGLYTLFAPLPWLGMSRERVAVRLALTLHYAEVAMLRGKGRLQDTLAGLFEPQIEVDERVQRAAGATNNLDDVVYQPDQMDCSRNRILELPSSPFALPDALLAGSALLMLWLAWR